MTFLSLLLFFFGAIGIFNSFLLSLYFLFFKKPKQLSKLLFGCFLFFISERALRSLIYFFSLELPNGYTQTDPLSFLFIGPFLFLYILSVLKPTAKLVRHWKSYILLWVIIAVCLYLKYPFIEDPIFWKKYILKAINLQYLVYILSAAYLIFVHYKKTNLANGKKPSIFLWLVLLVTSNLILWIIYFVTSFTYFATGSIVFSLLFYGFFLFFISKKKISAKVFNPSEKTFKKADENHLSSLIEQLQTYMTNEKPYTNPKLKLKDIADYLEVSTHHLSQLLNEHLGKSFATFVNEYRIEEAKRLIESNTKYSFDGIGKESGFNSKSTFYTVFKTIVGLTPAKYKELFFSSKL